MSSKIQKITFGLMGAIAFVAFVLSFSVLYDVAKSAGINPWLAWLWPFCLDAFMIALCLFRLQSALAGTSGAQVKRLTFLVFVFSLISVWFNMVEAGASALALAVFALPPTVVFAGVELLSAQVEDRAALDNELVMLAKAQAQVAALHTEAEDLQVSIAGLARQEIELQASVKTLAEREQELIAQPVDRLANIHATGRGIAEYAIENPHASAAEIARAVGVTAQNVTGHWLPKLEAEIGLHKNGNGWELAKV